MAVWFGKYNKNGYAFLNNGLGSSSNHLTNKKRQNLFNNFSIDALESGDIHTFNKSQKNVKLDNNYKVIYANGHTLLNNLKGGQSSYFYNCDESVDYFTSSKTTVFNTKKCDAQTYSTLNSINNTDCSNNYQGILLVDSSGNTVNSIVQNNTIYAQIKDVSMNDFNVLFTELVDKRNSSVYLQDFPNDC